MRIAVCDDQETCRRQVKGYIENIFGSLDVIVDLYSSGGEILKGADKFSYDIIFLDIEMPGMDGISLARKLRMKDEDVFLVFLTGHVEYALKGYEVNALRYLTKPVEEEKLKEVLFYVKKRQTDRRFLWLKTEAGEERVSVSDILYLEAQDQNVVIYTKGSSYRVRYNMGEYEKELRGDGFFRIHRSYLASLGKIKGLGKKEVFLEGDICLPVSRTRLGMEQVPKAYVMQSNGVLNAFSSFIYKKQYIEINAEIFEVAYREHHDMKALGFVIAHEMAHIYYGHATLHYNLPIWFSTHIPVIGAIASRTREYSADRLAQRIAETDGVEAMFMLAVDRHLYKMVDREDYLREAAEQKGFFVWLVNLMADHPVLCKRVRALDAWEGSGELY